MIDVVKDVGRGLINRHVPGAGDRVGSGAGMNGTGLEAERRLLGGRAIVGHGGALESMAMRLLLF